MITQTNSAALRSAYPTKTFDTKTSVNAPKQESLTKTEQLKESINSGEYRVNIQAISEKMAESLL
jgi:anti-sigma28 factor (negative regulator of flagellin synthesis)